MIVRRSIPLIKPGMPAAIARGLAETFGKVLPTKGRAWLNAVGYIGSYAVTDPSRKMLEGMIPRNATSDQTLTWNLTSLIALCRQLERNNASFKGLVEGWKSDVVGTGIDIEPDTGDDKQNARIADEWHRWCENCTPDGKTLWELQAQAMIEWCTAGANLWRDLIIPDRADDDRIPYCLSPIEVEWLTITPIGPVPANDFYVRGIQMDRLGRPVAYHVMDYNLLNQMGLNAAWGGPGEVIPASQIIHGFEYRRPRQSLGEPLLANVIERCFQDGRLVDTELKSAIAGATVAGVIKSLDQEDWDASSQVVDQYGNVTNNTASGAVTDMPVGTWGKLAIGEDLEQFVNNRPSQQIMPFRDGLRGDLAAGARSSQQHLDRNSARANYSAMRCDEMLTTRTRGPTQAVFGRYVASMPYERVLPYILLRCGIEMPRNPAAKRRLFQHKMMPDKAQYVDPVKDSAAAVYMIDNGLSTLEEECGNRGRELRKIRAQRAREQADSDAAAIARIANIQAELKKQGVSDVTWSDVAAIGGATSSPAAFLAAMAAAQEPEPAPEPVPKGKTNAA